MDKYCKQFLANPKVDPRTNKQITNQVYDNFVNTCEKRGFDVSDLKYEQPFNVFSDEMILAVFNNLDAKGVFELCMSDKKFKNLCDERFWRSMYRKHFPDALLEEVYDDTYFNYFRMSVDAELLAKFLRDVIGKNYNYVDVYEIKRLSFRSTYIPEEIYTAINLEILEVSGGLTEIPNIIGNLKFL